MKITSLKEVQALLVESYEINVPHYGLHTRAKYEVKSLGFIYTVEFWSRHAPCSILADIVSIKVADDAPMLVTDGYGHPLKDEQGRVKVTRNIVVMCPKLPEKDSDGNSVYYRGHNPEAVAQRYINRYLTPTVWGGDSWVKKSAER